MYIQSLTDVIHRTSYQSERIMFADDLYSINISCILCSGLGEKDISPVLKSDELLAYVLDSQAFLEVVYSFTCSLTQAA